MENTNTAFDLNIPAAADGIVKLMNGEVVDGKVFDKIIALNCHYVRSVIVAGNGRPFSLALIFPDFALFSQPDYMVTPLEGCFCPRNINEFGRCMTGCMRMINKEIDHFQDRVKHAVIINEPLMPGSGTKIMTDNEILEKFDGLIEDIYKGKMPVGDNMYYININHDS
jgi:long-subunit acyl-CoA synthetase (AMP-forming)